MLMEESFFLKKTKKMFVRDEMKIRDLNIVISRYCTRPGYIYINQVNL